MQSGECINIIHSRTDGPMQVDGADTGQEAAGRGGGMQFSFLIFRHLDCSRGATSWILQLEKCNIICAFSASTSFLRIMFS